MSRLDSERDRKAVLDSLLNFEFVVPFKRIGECCSVEKGNTPIQKAIPGQYPLVATTEERQTSATYQFDAQAVCVPLISSRGHGVASISRIYYQEGKFALGNILCAIIPNDSTVLSAKFLRYYLYRAKDWLLVPLMRGGANVSLTIDSLKKVKIPIPPLEIQNEIVRILDAFTELTAELTAELDARKKQAVYYKDKLLDIGSERVQYELQEVCHIVDCPHTSPKWKESGVPVIRNYNLVNGIINTTTLSYVDEDEYAERTKRIVPKKDDILFSREAPIGNVGLVPEGFRCCQGQRVVLLRPNSEIVNPSYLLHTLQGTQVKKQIQRREMQGATVSNFNIADLKKLQVDIPTLEIQNEIVEKLNRFDKLCNDISEGIPAEIEARRKQYEHYRDSLLTFKEKTA